MVIASSDHCRFMLCWHYQHAERERETDERSQGPQTVRHFQYVWRFHTRLLFLNSSISKWFNYLQTENQIVYFFSIVLVVIYCALLINRFLLKCWDRAFVYVSICFLVGKEGGNEEWLDLSHVSLNRTQADHGECWGFGIPVTNRIDAAKRQAKQKRTNLDVALFSVCSSLDKSYSSFLSNNPSFASQCSFILGTGVSFIPSKWNGIDMESCFTATQKQMLGPWMDKWGPFNAIPCGAQFT